MTVFFRVYLSLVALFSVHRYLSIHFLRSTFEPESVQERLKEILTGSLSDLWVSFILAFPVFILTLKQPSKKILILSLSWVVLWASLAGGHQNYVEYFRHQIIPFHIPYLVDTSFLSANSSSFLSVNSMSIFLLGSMLGLALIFWLEIKPYRKSHNVAIFFAIAVVSILAHTVNIRLRVNWFIPESLQYNFIENLYAGLSSKTPPKPVTPDELKTLADYRGYKSSQRLKEILRLGEHNDGKELQAIRSEVSNLRRQKKSPLILAVAAESFRPADSGWTRSQSDPESITPIFDQLITRGVNFTNTYSTGPVTRGGQEAIWCGVPSATNTSLMRSFPNFPAVCVPDLAGAKDHSIWIHGGDPRFDNQDSFWKKHGVNQLVIKTNFDPGSASTGWGISDATVMSKAAEMAQKNSSINKDNPPILHMMVLSVTNHIPWDLPKDTPEGIRKIEVSHPSHLTTAYFDHSLGLFITHLKQAGLWDQTLLLLASDHGNFEPHRNTSYRRGSPVLYEMLASHMNLVLSGGIIERLVAQNALPEKVEAPASQAQIAPFLASVSGYDTTNFMDTPLFDNSLWPVAVDLNQYLFLPVINLKAPKEDVLSGRSTSNSNEEQIASLRYRGFLEILFSSGTH
jgi:phosphoglycerol transferase MdoB-like AlkP superfamily enzyme